MTVSLCVFCNIVNDQIPVPKVWESVSVVAFRDANPSAQTHLLIIPKAHVLNFEVLEDPALWEEMRQAARGLVRDFNLTAGYKLIVNGGKYQHIPHLHWHLLGGELKPNP